MLGDDVAGLDLVGDLAAGQGVRARVDDGDRRPHEADLQRLRGRLDERAAGARVHGRAQLRRLRGDADAVARRAGAAVPDRVLRSGGGHDVERPPRRARSATRNLICADVGGTSTDISPGDDGQPFVNDTFELEHDLLVNALSTEISSVGAGGGSIVSITAGGRDPGRSRRAPAPTPARPCYGRGGTEPTMTDAFLLMGILDPGRLRRRRDAPRLGARARRRSRRSTRRCRSSERVAYAYRIAVAQHRRGDHRRRDPPRRRPARLHAGGLRRRRADAAAGALDQLQRAARDRVPPHPGLFSALGLLSSDLVYADSRSAYMVLTPDAARRRSTTVFERDGARAARAALGTDGGRRSSCAAASTAGCSARPGRRRSSRSPAARSAASTMRADDRELPRRLRARATATASTLVPVQGVTYRVAARVPIDKVEYASSSPRDGGEPRRPGRATIDAALPTSDEQLDGAASTSATTLTPVTRSPGPAIIREALSTTLVCARAAARRVGEPLRDEI